MIKQHYEWALAAERTLAHYAQPDDLPEAFRLPKYINRLDLLRLEGPQGVAEQLYDLLYKQGIHYELSPFNPRASVTQLIRKPTTILDKKKGTCLDLAVLFAAMCLANDLLPLVVVVEGHAFAGLSLTRTRHDGKKPPRPLAWKKGKLTDLSVLQELHGQEYLFIECTGAAQSQALSSSFPEGREREGNGRMSFERACEAGREQLLQHAWVTDGTAAPNQRMFLYALDIHDLQVNHGFEPVQDEASGSVFKVERQINTDGGAYIQGNVNTGGGDFVGRDKIDQSIKVGDIKDAVGVAIGHGAQANVTQTVGATPDEITRAFAIILQAANALPEESKKKNATLAVQNLEFEAHRGEQADESQVRRWFAFLAETSVDVWEVAVKTLSNPIAGISLVVQKIAQRAKDEKAQRGG